LASDAKERIALLFGIPVTRDEFLARSEDLLWDYGRKLFSRDTAVSAFENIYKPVCSIAADLIDAAVLAGVSVYRKAQLQDVESASRSHKILVIVAHWRGSVVDEPDLSGGWLAHLKAGKEDGVIACLLNEMGLSSDDLRSIEPDGDLRELLIGSMNRVIESGTLRRFFPTGLDGVVSTHRLIADALSRDLLDVAFADALRPGNQLELADGLHSVTAMDAAISRDFSGAIDLSCCTSSVLGTSLKLQRGDSIQVVMGDNFIVPGPQLRLIEQAFRLLAIHPSMKYVDVRLALGQGLADSVREQ